MLVATVVVWLYRKLMSVLTHTVQVKFGSPEFIPQVFT